MAKQKPPNPQGERTLSQFDDSWEELGAPEKPLYDHGGDRTLIDWKFARARELDPTGFDLTKIAIFRTLIPLNLPQLETRRLTRKLFYLAGHYYSPRFHKIFGDDLAASRRKLRSIENRARKLERLMSELTYDECRQLNQARWSLPRERRCSPFPDWPALRDYIAVLAESSEIVAAELPQFRRGSTEKVLLGRWLRQSAKAIEEATGGLIVTKTRDSEGRNYRFASTEGQVFEAYCRLVDRGLSTRSMVETVRGHRRSPADPPKSQDTDI